MKVSLRAKSMFALVAGIAAALALALLVGVRALHAIEMNLGSAYVRNATQYNKQRILTPVLREMALAQRLADSEITRHWIADEDSPEARSMFFAEADRYRQAFSDRSFFVASARSGHYYFSDGEEADERKPRYTLKRGATEDAWFFNTMRHGRDTNLNVDVNNHLKVTKVWFNIKVKDGKRDVGLVGTGLDLTTFLREFITDHGAGVTPMILNRDGAIQAHPDASRIAYAAINNKPDAGKTLYALLDRPKDDGAARDALRIARQDPSQPTLFWAEMDGKLQLFAVSFLPELGWNVVTAVDLKAARLLDGALWRTPIIVGITLLGLLGVVLVMVLNRIVLRPLEDLTRSARSMARGDYGVSLPPPGTDEIGQLTRAFDAMATRVRTHTEELEETVRRRTAELRETNDTLEAAGKTMADGIRYAGVIQSAILPDRMLEHEIPGDHFVLWRPRDVVGGDFYVFHHVEGGFLMGVVDCAGHGVPGALMTMAAHAALTAAVETIGPQDPAALLAEMDRRVRASVPESSAGAGIAAHMDAGLAWFDAKRDAVVFAGARTALYWSDGKAVEEIPGTAVSIAGRRLATFENRVRPMPADGTFYLTTDGFLDQAGGSKGYGFGDRRFSALVRAAAALPAGDQHALFEAELETWSGAFPQRDDITVLGLSRARTILGNMNGSQRRLSTPRNIQQAADTAVL